MEWIDTRTGRFKGTSDYELVFERLRKYADRKIGKIDRNITDQKSLLNFLDTVDKERAGRHHNLAYEIKQTNMYQNLVAGNREQEQEKVTKQQLPRGWTLDKEYAKKNKKTVLTYDSRGRQYAYNYRLGRRLSIPKKYKQSKIETREEFIARYR